MLEYIVKYWDKAKTKKMCEEWKVGGLYHRKDGPAFIYYNEDESILYEWYYVNGKEHRENGPTYISYNRDGSIERKLYWINGEHYTEEEWFDTLPKKQKIDYLLRG